MTQLNARGMRILHVGLTLGLTFCGLVLFVVRRAERLPALVPSPAVGMTLAVIAIAEMAVTFTILRPRVPSPAPEDTPDAFWSAPTTRGWAILLWCGVGSGGLLAAVGYFLTGVAAPGMVVVLAVFTLVSLRPGGFERDEA